MLYIPFLRVGNAHTHRTNLFIIFLAWNPCGKTHMFYDSTHASCVNNNGIRIDLHTNNLRFNDQLVFRQ